MKKTKIGLKELKIESFVTQLSQSNAQTAQGGAFTQNILCGTNRCGGPTRGIILCTGT